MPWSLVERAARCRCRRRGRSRGPRCRPPGRAAPGSSRAARGGRRATESGSKPTPRSSTNTRTWCGDTRTRTLIRSTPACLAALVTASRAASTSASSTGVHRQVGGLDEADRDGVGVLDLVDDRAQGARQGRRGVRVLAAVEPGPQLTVLAPRELPRALAVGRPLDQRQGLEDRVVQARRDPLALLDPDALAPLRLGLGAHAAQARADQQPDAGGDGARREGRRDHGADAARLGDGERDPGPDQQDAAERPGAARDEALVDADADLPSGAAPDQGGSRAGQGHRPEHPVGEGEAGHLHQRGEAPRDGDRPDRHGGAAAQPGARPLGEWHSRGGDDVERDPDAADRDGGEEGDSHQGDIDAERAREPSGDAGDHALVGGALQAAPVGGVSGVTTPGRHDPVPSDPPPRPGCLRCPRRRRGAASARAWSRPRRSRRRGRRAWSSRW